MKRQTFPDDLDASTRSDAPYEVLPEQNPTPEADGPRDPFTARFTRSEKGALKGGVIVGGTYSSEEQSLPLDTSRSNSGDSQEDANPRYAGPPIQFNS